MRNSIIITTAFVKGPRSRTSILWAGGEAPCVLPVRIARAYIMVAWMFAFFASMAAELMTTSVSAAGQQTNELIAGPTIAILRSDTNVTILFKGTLQSAAAVTGPWNDVPNASTPHQPGPVELQRFYRARTPDSIFASTSVVALTLIAPFQNYFDLAYAGLPDGIFPPVREKPYFDGSLQMTGFAFPISLRVRGNSSLQECPFPKLKFKVSREQREGTPFFDAREVKIGTHCAEGGRGTIGRLREQIATFREALAYETMGVLGFVTPRVRRARIDYHDTTSTNTSPMAGWQLTRDALILDDTEVVAARMGGRALDDEEVSALTNANFNVQLITDLQFFHALLGNWDYKLSTNGVALWNTEVIELANGDLLPMTSDFDLASWVTGLVRFMGPQSYHPELPDADRQARYELEQIKQRVSPAIFTAAMERFETNRSAIESQIGASLLDEPGRSNCLRHVTAFYDAVNAVTR